MKNICVVTGSRAEYGLLKGIISIIQSDDELMLQLIVTGSHLSDKHGSTYKDIESDGFNIDWKVNLELNSDSPYDIIKSMGNGLLGFADAYQELNPDFLILLGDRYEILMAACAAMMNQIPIAHLCGGEVTQGAIDDVIRHCITKMSYLHFTSTEEYRRRVIQLGESPDRVFCFGNTGVENILLIELLDKDKLVKNLNFPIDHRTLLITFHPVTNESVSSEDHFKELLKAIDHCTDIKAIFTKANADAGGESINQLINEYVERNPQKAICFASLGQLKYLSAMKYCGAVVGNSSSGIIEAPALGIPSVNIGSRQTGRLKANSIIDCLPTSDEIQKAIQQAQSIEFRSKIDISTNPYQGIGVAANIVSKIKGVILNDIIHLDKLFYDL